MRVRSWPVAAAGMAGLLLLIAGSLVSAARQTASIYQRLEQVNTHHHEVEARLRQLRSDVHLSGIFIRDYLLDSERSRGQEYRQRLRQFRTDSLASIQQVRALMGDAPNAAGVMLELEATLNSYWQGFETVVDWSPQEKATRSAAFIRSEMLPKRESALTVARQVEQLNHVSLADERARVEAQFTGLQSYLRRVLWISLIAGLVVASVSVQRLRVAEHRAAAGQDAAQAAEQRIRNLSLQLVATQEDERRRISRELHDHLGQMLTALRLELGRIDRLRVPTNQPAAEAIVESRQLVDQIIKVVRDLAMGLRPSMLDDLGLVPALEWLTRDFTRRFGIPVGLEVGTDIASLPEQYRTCIFRVVQEGLTNCARHSGASEVTVALLNAGNHLNVVIRDDGVGMDSTARSEGLGIRGMEERVRELDGWLNVQSTPGRGTTLNINLPVGGPDTETALATAAG